MPVLVVIHSSEVSTILFQIDIGEFPFRQTGAGAENSCPLHLNLPTQPVLFVPTGQGLNYASLTLLLHHVCRDHNGILDGHGIGFAMADDAGAVDAKQRGAAVFGVIDPFFEIS